MIDSGSTQARSRTGPPHLEIVRRTNLGMGIGVVVQYALGIWVNLYVTVPARDQGGGFLAAIGRALANGPVALGLHAGLGLLLVLGSISLVVRSVLSRNRAQIVLSAVFLLALLGAASSGASFVNSDNDSASASMAMLTGVALICSLISLFLLGSARGAAQHEGRATPVSPDDAGGVPRVVARADAHGVTEDHPARPGAGRAASAGPGPRVVVIPGRRAAAPAFR